MWLQRTSAPTATPASRARGMVARTRYSAAIWPNPSSPDTSTLAATAPHHARARRGQQLVTGNLLQVPGDVKDAVGLHAAQFGSHQVVRQGLGVVRGRADGRRHLRDQAPQLRFRS